VAKRDSPAKRLRKLTAFARVMYKQPPPVPKEFPAELKNGVRLRAIGFLDNLWTTHFRPAFLECRLDPLNPRDWEIVIYFVFWVQFGKSSGRKEFWNEGRLCRLACDFAHAKAANPGQTDAAIRELLVKDGRYRKVKCSTIRRRMPEARRKLARVIAQYQRCVELNLGSLTPAQESQLAEFIMVKYRSSTSTNNLA